MNIFTPTLNQILYLFLLIFTGFLLTKIKIIPINSDVVLSKLESYVFIPALILSTFMTNFTVDNIMIYGIYFLAGIVVGLLCVIFSIFISKIIFKDRKLYTYGLALSNFGFMGNAVVLALFPDLFTEYLLFVLPFWLLVYVWGTPLILSITNEKISIKKRLKSLINPMVLSMVLGIVIGIINIKFPPFINTSISSLATMMTPIAMIITGMTIGKNNLFEIITYYPIYLLSLFRLIIIPIITIFILKLLQVPYNLSLCILSALAMPLGLNSIIILNAYGFDTKEASGMALISHVLSLATIPLIFSLFNYIFKITYFY